MKFIILIILIIPLLGRGQKTVSSADSLKKYQKLYNRDQDSLKKYTKKVGWNEHYFRLCEKRKEQIHYWSDQIYLTDRRERRQAQ
jgi:hypothetical protein